MTIKTLLAAAALVVAPTLGLAMGCSSSKHETQAMSCADGTVYDPATNTCTVVSG